MSTPPPLSPERSGASDESDTASPPPRAMPHPPKIITPALLARLKSHPQLPRHSWYVISSVTLSALNRPDEIPTVFLDAISGAQKHEEQLSIARRIREGLVKSAAVVGMPKIINALFTLKSSTPPALLDDRTKPSPTMRAADVYDTPSDTILQRGDTFFNRVYGKVSKRVMRQLDSSGTEDLGVTARLVYGYLLSNSRILTPAESSYVLISALIPQDVNPQLKGHLRGALNNGATEEEVRAVREVCVEICKESGMRRLGEGEIGGWGWREEVVDV